VELQIAGVSKTYADYLLPNSDGERPDNVAEVKIGR
jgi:hypothetical protein